VASVALHRISGFAECLRAAGVPVAADDVIRAVQALNALDLSDDDALYWGTRASMVRRSEHLPAFDHAFRHYWRGSTNGGTIPSAPTESEQEQERHEAMRRGTPPSTAVPTSTGAEPPPRGGADSTDDGETSESLLYSAEETLRRKDFADYSDRDYERLDELLRTATFAGAWRRTRRTTPHRRGRTDVRRTLRAAFGTSGDPVRLLRRQRRYKHRRLTFVCDVSGSMARYSRAVLQLSHVATGKRRQIEAFAFATRLTRLTEELTLRDPTEALRAAADKVVDWSGGTRVGDCLERLNREYASMVRGAIVIVASDGWDLGDPDRLTSQAALLQRMSYRVIWVNPHLQDPEFEPLTRGMSAALPHVDEFISCHNYESFTTLLGLLDEL
jgi:uncharacterized protein with von Willebrand factor type A (vWA) domain